MPSNPKWKELAAGLTAKEAMDQLHNGAIDRFQRDADTVSMITDILIKQGYLDASSHTKRNPRVGFQAYEHEFILNIHFMEDKTND